jgi:hypothetical protein
MLWGGASFCYPLVKTVVAGLFGAPGVYVCLFINRILVSAADDW